MSPPREEARHNSGLPQEATTATEEQASRLIVQGVNDLVDSLLNALASLPYWIPRWLDRLAIRAAQRMGSEGTAGPTRRKGMLR